MLAEESPMKSKIRVVRVGKLGEGGSLAQLFSELSHYCLRELEIRYFFTHYLFMHNA